MFHRQMHILCLIIALWRLVAFTLFNFDLLMALNVESIKTIKI